MLNQRKVSIFLIVLLASVLVLPQLTLAYETIPSFSQDTLKEHVQNLREKEKQRSAILATEKKKKLARSFSQVLMGSQEQSLSYRSSNLDKTFEDFRRNYQKQNEIKTRSVNKVELSAVNDRGIILKLYRGKTLDAAVFDVQIVSVSEQLESGNIYLVKVPDKYDYNKKLLELKGDPKVRNAEPDYLLDSSFVPSDPQYDRQWYLDQIDMTKAWDINKGSKDVTIAVLDTGVNANHPDLGDRVLAGYDFVNNDNNASDDNGHGTHVAGIIASNANNTGISGIDFNAKILPVKVGNRNGVFSRSDVISGIYYAIDQGADVINMSYGSYSRSLIEEDALWDAYNQGIVLVAAAGNDNTLNEMYPASYTPVISVAATIVNDRRAGFSNYGGYIDMTAPGENILSTNYLGGYKLGDGTSFSAPIVSALAGLLKAQHSSWNPNEIEWALEYGSDSLDGKEWNIFDGFGRANAYGTLTAKLPSLQSDAANIRVGAKALQQNVNTRDKMDLPMDVDWFTFQVPESAKVTVDLADIPEYLDLIGMLYKYDGNTVLDQHLIDNEGMGKNESLEIEAEPGTYYLTVYDFYNHWSQDMYDINIAIDKDSNDSNLIMEQEPNDSMYTANKLPFDSIGGGYFQLYDDFDFFEVRLPYNGDIRITTATDRYANYNDPAALLIDTDGDIIAEADVLFDEYESTKFLTEIFEDIKSGTYYIALVNLQSYSDNSNPYIFDVSYFGDITGEVPIPQASKKSGTYDESIEVELTTKSDAEIKYTLDGSTPGLTNGQVYNDPIKLVKDTTLKAVAIKNDVASKVVTYEYTIEQLIVQPPTASIPSGDFTSPFELELTSDQLGASIIYTLDGSTPTPSNGDLYDKPIPINESTVVKTFAIIGDVTSDVKTFSYNYISAPESGSPIFPDVNLYQTEIEYLSDKGIILGYQDGTFRPDNNVTRLQAVQMILNEMGIDVEKSNSPNPGFEDVKPGAYGYNAVATAVELGFIKGKQDNTFDKGGYLTRGQMAAILVSAYNLEGTNSKDFNDVPKGHWAYQAVSSLAANNITKGYADNTFRPNANVSRQHFSVFLYNYLVP